MGNQQLRLNRQQSIRFIGLYVMVPIVMVMFVLVCIGCDRPTDMGGGVAYNGPKNECVSDHNCTVGRCHEQLSICAVTNAGNETLYAKVIFEGTTVNPQVFSVPMTSTEELRLEVATPIPFDVVPVNVDTETDDNIEIDTDVNVDILDADILFIDRSNTLLNKTPSVEVYKTYLDESSFFLLPGAYDVTIYPVGNDALVFPVYNMEDVVIQSDGTALQDNLPVEIGLPHPDASSYDLFEGHVVYPSRLSEEDYAEDLYVQAFHLETNQILSKSLKLECVVPPPDNKCEKNISIPLFPGTTSVGLRFFKPEEPFYPVHIYRIESLNISEAQRIEIQPLQKPVLVQGTVEVSGLSSGATPPPGCRILFETIDDPQRTLEYWVQTNSSGIAERVEGAEGVYLYPNNYKVTAYPIDDNVGNGHKFSPTELSDTLIVTNEIDEVDEESDAAVNEFSIRLEERIQIVGEVKIGDATVPQANISAFNIEKQHPYSRNLTASSDSKGAFGLWLEHANYFVTVQAPPDSKYAIGDGIWNIRQSKSYSFTGKLQIPFVIMGQLEVTENPQWDKTIDFNKVTIEWYKQFGQNVYLVARSKVNGNGTFSALLPPN